MCLLYFYEFQENVWRLDIRVCYKEKAVICHIAVSRLTVLCICLKERHDMVPKRLFEIGGNAGRDVAYGLIESACWRCIGNDRYVGHRVFIG